MPPRFHPETVASISLAGAEISAFDAHSKRVFVTSNSGLIVVDATNPRSPSVLTTISFNTPEIGLDATDITSVAIRNGVVAVAVPAAVKSSAGHVVFLNAATGAFLGKCQVGIHPDHLCFTPDGSRILTANEGEMLPDGTDPSPGSVSIIDVSNGPAQPSVTTVGFGAFDASAAALKAAGVRIFEQSPGVLRPPSLDFEPEYIAVSPDSTRAMVTLQEANALAVLDLTSATFTQIVPLGEKDYSTLLSDFSDRDGPSNSQKINLATGNPVFGLYMPDAIASFQVGGQTYYISANEGDDRNDFMNPDETTTVNSASYVLDPVVFPNAATLKTNARLGRLTVSNAPGLRGDTDGDSDIDRILSYGGRSVSIHDANGTRVWDSGDLIDTTIAALGAPYFDDGRSDNKSTEPEGVTIGVVDGRVLAFVALERSRGVLVFDVSNPTSPSIVGFVPSDLNPEAITFVPANDSPLEQPMLLVTNEASNTLTFHTFQPFSLQLLHVSDAEAGLLAAQTAPKLAALVDAFDAAHPHTLIVSGGDHYIPGPFMSAGTDTSLNAVPAVGKTAFGRPDMAILNALGIEVAAIGNHEWDLGSAVFADAIRPDAPWEGARFPHLSANLDFSGDSATNARFVPVPLDGTATAVPAAADQAGKIVPTVMIEKGGRKIGVVGVTTQLIESISSPGGVEVRGFPTGAGPNGEADDMDLLASQIQPYLDELTAEGAQSIILLSHLQQLSNEQSLATKLRGVDVIVAAGSNTRLGDADDLAVEFPGHAATFAGTYPLVTAGSDGAPTLIVSTDNEFTYLGRLVVDFDSQGRVIPSLLASRTATNGAYAATDANVAQAWGVTADELATSAYAPGTKAARVAQVTSAVNAVIQAKDGTVYGFTQVYLEGERSAVRSEETNLGNLTADANAAALRRAIPGVAPLVSLKNGGGIRAQIGAVSSASGSAAKLPPPANPTVGKAEGGVSQLDVENALRFNNLLVTFETTPAGLKAILEHGVAAWPNQGRFPQVGGLAFAWNPALPAGQRIVSMALTNATGAPAAALVADGNVVTNAPQSIQVVTLNFMANDGDGYPMKANGSQFRYLLQDGTLGPILDEATSFTQAPQLPAGALGEQAALASFLSQFHASPASAYRTADTPASNDTRIQRLDVRSNAVLPASKAEWTILNGLYPLLLAQGIDPATALADPTWAASLRAGLQAARSEVTSNPAAYSLYTADTIQDLRGSGNLLIQASGNEVILEMPLQRSATLNPGGWEPAPQNLRAVLPKTADKEFYRLELPR